MLKKYRVFRTSIYLVEIGLMFWPQNAVSIYDEVVDGHGWFLNTILYGLYVQIFWYALIFFFTVPCWLCENRPNQEVEFDDILLREPDILEQRPPQSLNRARGSQ